MDLSLRGLFLLSISLDERMRMGAVHGVIGSPGPSPSGALWGETTPQKETPKNNKKKKPHTSEEIKSAGFQHRASFVR